MTRRHPTPAGTVAVTVAELERIQASISEMAARNRALCARNAELGAQVVQLEGENERLRSRLAAGGGR